MTWLVSKSRSTRLHPTCILQVHVSFLRFAHLSSLISYFCRTIKVMSCSSVFALPLFSFIVLLPHRSLHYRMPFCFCCLFCSCRPQFLSCCCCSCVLHSSFPYSVERHRQHFGVCVCSLLFLCDFFIFSQWLLHCLRFFISCNMESRHLRV